MRSWEGADLILEWCSARGSGSRRSFDNAYRSVLGSSGEPWELLRDLELSCHVEVEWTGRRRWWVAPTVLSLIEGAAGNAVLLGARSSKTLALLEELLKDHEIDALTIVPQGACSPSAVFVGVPSVAALERAAQAIGAEAKTSVRLEYKDSLACLETAVAYGRCEHLPSSDGIRRLNPITLRFEACDAAAPGRSPGCYELLVHHVRRYFFVSDQHELHRLDRWLAVHAEIQRARTRGIAAPIPLSWSPETESLLCDARAQLPTMWARAAVMSSGLLPIRRSGMTDDRHAVEYRGVLPTTYNRIRTTLGYPAQQAEIPWRRSL